MKKILLLFILSLAVTGFSQLSISVKDLYTGKNVVANDTIHLPSIPNDFVERDFDLKNNSGNTNSYILIRYDIKLHKLTPNVVYRDSAHAHFCFATKCFGPSPNISPTTVLTPSQSTSDLQGGNQILTAVLEETLDENTAGINIVKYTFFNLNNLQDSLQFVLKYSPNTVGLSEWEKISGSVLISPNPTNGPTDLKLLSNKAFESQLVIYNSIGEVIKTTPIQILVGENTFDLTLDSFSKGFYHLSLKAGEKSITKKLIIN